MTQQTQIVPFKGGLDLITPAALVQPGYAIGGDNYEVEARGYRRMEGYERFDGRFKPSEADYYILPFQTGTLAFGPSALVTGAVSGATGYILVAATLASGSYGGGNATGDLILYNVTGTFVLGEGLKQGGVTCAVASAPAVRNGSGSDTDHDTYIASVTALRRAVIAAPSGSGPIRGVVTYQGETWCFRDNLAGTAGQMFKATSGGWIAQAFGSTLDFKDGAVIFSEGDVVVGASSGATGIVQRVVRQSGAWAGSAAGFLVLSNVTGTFNASEIITSAAGRARSNGANAVITLPPGGTFECIVANFYATEGRERLYFTSRTGRAFEWDGTILAPIRTGMPEATDLPQHIAFHRNHLFLTFDGGSLQNSSIGSPLEWDAITGAAEIGFSQDITALLSDTRDSLVVGGVQKIGYLTGSSSSDFNLASITESSGIIEGTIAAMASPIFMDDMGLRDLQASQVYGNWNIGTITQMVEPLLLSKKAGGILPAGCIRVRSKAQYRLFLSDDTGFFVYLGRKSPEIMTFTLGFSPVAFHSGRDSQGQEVLFLGSSDGMVYQMDAGTSFDGDPISAFVRLSWLNQGNSMQKKRYHRARLEGSPATTDTVIRVAADFSYASSDVPSLPEATSTMYGAGGFWDTASWDEFQWSSEVESSVWIDIGAIGDNAALVFSSESATETPHVLSTLAVNWSPRRSLR
jgi:hypothetical protein